MTLFMKSLFLISLCLLSPQSFGKTSFHLEEIYQVELDKLRPTQAVIGIEAMEERYQKLLTKLEKKPSKLAKYLRRKIIPVILRKTKKSPIFYMIDGHHTMRALSKLQKKKKQIFKPFIKIIFNGNNYSEENFWKIMIKRNWVYLKKRGKKIKPKDLPQSLLALEDDPYRTLSFKLRRLGCYDNLRKIPFQEFLYADFLREHRIQPFEVEKAKTLVTSKKAFEKRLPGYRKTCYNKD